MASVLAHQGGWDEILLVLAPILIVVALLALAKRRVTRAVGEARDTARDGSDGSDAAGRPGQDVSGTRSIAAPTSRRRPTRSS